VVVTGCAPEVVGDDVPAMVKEAREQGFPVISASTPGFKGSIYHGNELVVKAIIDQLPSIHKPVGKQQQPFVNLWGILPGQHPFWDGTLNEIERILSLAGFQTNKLIGQGQGLESWLRVPHASLNLSLSPWGNEVVRHLEETYHTPSLQFGWVPVGAEDTGWLLTLLSLKLNIDPDIILDIRRREETKVKYQVQKISDAYFSYDFQKEVALVGDTAFITGLARFLQETFGQQVKTIVITDNPAENLREGIIKTLTPRKEFVPEVVFLADGTEIDELLLKKRPEVIFGSSLEKSVSRQLNIPLITVSTPVFDRCILNHHYAGYSGAISLVEDFSSRMVSHQQELHEKSHQHVSASISKQKEETLSELSIK
jgi:nitrogenase molybdenum-iron protein beta chain